GPVVSFTRAAVVQTREHREWLSGLQSEDAGKLPAAGKTLGAGAIPAVKRKLPDEGPAETMPDVEIGKSALAFQKIEVVLRQDGGTVGARAIEIRRFIDGFRERVVQLERHPLSELLAEPRLQAVIVRIHHRLRC